MVDIDTSNDTSTSMNKQNDILKLRKKLHKKQDVFAVELGVSVKTLSTWENSSKPPSEYMKMIVEKYLK